MTRLLMGMGSTNDLLTQRHCEQDDCWQAHRALDSKGDFNGTILAEPSRFPSGLKGIADYIHHKNLFFGICGGINVLLPLTMAAMLVRSLESEWLFCGGRRHGAVRVHMPAKGRLLPA